MAPTARTKVFVSYSHADKRWLKDLHTHLAPLAGQFSLWDDSQQLSGKPWRSQIEEALAECKAAVLLVSPDFLASRFIAESEVSPLLAAADATGVPLLCIYARPSAVAQREYTFERASGERCTVKLTDHQGLNDPAQPLSPLTKAKRDQEWVAIGERFERALKETRPQALAPATRGDPNDSLTEPQANAPARAYLERLRDSTRWLELRGLRAERAEQVELERVYTRLRVVGPSQNGREDPTKGGRGGLGAEVRDRELHELLNDHPCLALIGAPGSGKSTFLQFVALNLSRAGLDDERDACLARLGLHGGPPFPILVRLADFARFLETTGAAAVPTDCAELFYRFLDQPAPGLPSHLPGTFRRRWLTRGGCMLLLDGLDEVPGNAVRARVSTIIGDVVAEGLRLGNRHVVTCRTRAYEGRTRLGAEFTRALLVDFGDREVETFVRQWSRALLADQPNEAAELHAHNLMTAIRAHPHVRPLTRNPLLLTVLAVVHWDRKKLPEQRADLYDVAVESLLESRPGDGYSPTERRHGLQAVALRFFADSTGVRKTLDRHEAIETLSMALNVGERVADRFLANEELHSGLIISRREGEIEFSHMTFGEHLAALDLAWRGRKGWDFLRPHVFDPTWGEIVLLFAGCLWKRGPRLVLELIDNILAEGTGLTDRARQVGLIGRILRDVRVRAEGHDPSANTGYAAALSEVLAAFKSHSAVPEAVRIDVGEALGQAGDPRLHEDDHDDRVFIEGGAFLMGADELPDDRFRDERPVHRVVVSSFWIDRYPVTVARYRRFVEAHDEHTPPNWDEQQRHPNWPVTLVTWHQAQAYCAWLSARSGRCVTLPTETQWEYAARGCAGRKYPWGDDEPTDQHMNFDNRVGHPTPVGVYPLGRTPQGIEDMAGNVWEWCRDWYGPYQLADACDPDGALSGKTRVLRGGAFNRSVKNCRAAFRANDHPGYVHGNAGIRCVAAIPGRRHDRI